MKSHSILFTPSKLMFYCPLLNSNSYNHRFFSGGVRMIVIEALTIVGAFVLGAALGALVATAIKYSTEIPLIRAMVSQPGHREQVHESDGRKSA